MPLGVLVLLLVIGLVVWLLMNRPEGAGESARPRLRPVDPAPVRPAPVKPGPMDEAEFRRQVRARAEAQRQAARQRDEDES
ncbi:MAG: hypothetical protein ABW215_06020 [Kibdelosporangium sp.]